MTRVTAITLSLTFMAAFAGAQNIHYTDNGQMHSFINPYPAEPWTCNSAYVPAERCYATWADVRQPDLYIINGAIPVDVPSMNRVFFYTQLYTKESKFGGPGNKSVYQQGGFTVFSAARTWHGIRGYNDLVLENDTARGLDDGREWTVDHGLHDGTRFILFANTPRNGNNTTYIDGYTKMGVSTNGITFTWYDMIFWQRDNDYRILGVFVLPDPNVPGQLSGVMTYLRHSVGLNGTASIKIHPNWSNPAASTYELFVQGWPGPRWKTFNFGADLTATDRPNSLSTPGGQTLGRINTIAKATYGGVTQYELWKERNAPLGPDPYKPSCAIREDPDAPDPKADMYDQNRMAWSDTEGGKVQYLFFDMNTLLPSGEYIDLTSTVPGRDITPADYTAWGTWMIGRVDYGWTNMLYLATRDGLICNLPNGWDTGTGKTILWMQLSESIQ